MNKTQKNQGRGASCVARLDQFQRFTAALSKEFPHTCPACKTKHLLAGELAAGAAVPKAGDITVCSECGAASKFKGAGELVQVSLDELDPKTRREVMRFQSALRDGVL